MEKPGIEPATPGLQGIALIPTLFCGFPGYKPVPPGWFKIVCWFYVGNTQRLTESGFMEKPGIEPATPGLQGIGLYGKQCGPRSDCSYGSSLFWVHTVCFCSYFISNARQLFAADDFSRRHFRMHFFLGALRVSHCLVFYIKNVSSAHCLIIV